MKINSDQAKPTRIKRLLFTSILILMPIIFLFLIEMFLRIINYGESFKLFVDFPGMEIQKHKIINPRIGKKYFHKLEHSNPCHDMFLKAKPENTFRIFVLGSSTVLGFPYDENLMFTRILQERLQISYPEKNIEVINTAMTAINSFTLLDFTDDILNEEPDAILIYAGHNEFYGALGIGSVEKSFSNRTITLLHLDLLNFRFYQLLQNLISGTGKFITGNNKDTSVKGTLMKVIANNKEIPYNSDIYAQAISIYEKNMGKILEKAKQNNVPVFISELVCNIKDLRPFCSTTTADYPLASNIYNEAQQAEKEGDFEKAKSNYYLAKDLDCIRFRASEEINEVIHKLALQYKSTLVPMKSSFFEQASPHLLIGNNLMTEHLHPNIDGYFLMADAFFYSIAESKLLGEKLDIVSYKNSAYYQKNWGYTVIDSLMGVHRVNILKQHWPFQSFDTPFIDYIKIYQPISLADSLALDVLENKIKTYQAHQIMAEFYKRKGDYYYASKEYQAAIKCNPYQLAYYFEVANCLVKINDIALALKFINKSLDLEESFYGYFRKGEILIMKGEFDESVLALNKALKLNKEPKNTFNVKAKLMEAYFYKGNNKKMNDLLKEIKKTNPDFNTDFPEKRVDYVFYVPVQVEKQIKEASIFYKDGNDNAALELLLKTIESKETSIANRLIGDILFRRNDKNAILYFLKAYPDYKKDIGFLYDLGILYLQLGVKDKALEILQEMKHIDQSSEKTIALSGKL